MRCKASEIDRFVAGAGTRALLRPVAQEGCNSSRGAVDSILLLQQRYSESSKPGPNSRPSAGDVSRDEARNRHRRASPAPALDAAPAALKPAGVAPEINGTSPAAGSPQVRAEAQPQRQPAWATAARTRRTWPHRHADFEQLYQPGRERPAHQATARAGKPEPPVASPNRRPPPSGRFLREHGIAPTGDRRRDRRASSGPGRCCQAPSAGRAAKAIQLVQRAVEQGF